MSTTTVVLSPSKDTVRRNKPDGTKRQGCGQSKHLYVGRYDGWDYDSFIKFNIDWTGLNIAKLVSAKLGFYTDEYNTIGNSATPGIMPAPKSTDTPKIIIRRLTSSFTVGDNADGHFTDDTSDYVNPSRTTSNDTSKVMKPMGANLLIPDIDVTAMVRAWAPSSVAGGGKATNHGFGLYGYNDTERNWSGWSTKHGDSSQWPTLTLVFEKGPTKPYDPGSNGDVLTPTGTIPSLDTFEGGFSDERMEDKLASTSIEIYDAGRSCTTALDNFVTTSNHGLEAGNEIYFTATTSTNITPFKRYFVLATGKTSSKFKISATLNGSVFDINDAGSGTWSKRVAYTTDYTASETDRTNAHFIVPKPADFTAKAGTTYRWRARYKDNEGQSSNWTGLYSFVLSNTAPTPPTMLTPPSGASVATMNDVKFTANFADPADGDALMAHQVQLSPFPPGDIRWDEADAVSWDSTKTYDVDPDYWEQPYEGGALAAGTYYWRARHWDVRDGVSAWTTPVPIILTQPFSNEPGVYESVQLNPNAPWRIIIRNLLQADGVTPTYGRGPGQVVAVLEEAKSVGASVVFNSPGELHFTLLKDDPQASVIEPRQVHYAVEFYSGDGWQEKYAGVVWDVDATETDLIFKCIDYLALYDTVIDERYDPLKPNKSYKAKGGGGSFYENVTIRTVILDQLNRAKKLTDSWVGFISIGAVAQMSEKVTVYSTMQPVLSFISGLIDSHRQGSGKRTRARVVKTSGGGYQFQIVDDPGVIRHDLALYYGELVQGYRVIYFGDGWANVEHVVGRNRDGVKVVYKTISGKPFQPSTSLYGRIATVAVMDGVQDQADLNRRGLQAAMQSAKLGKNIALGLRTEHLAPLSGYDVCDLFPVLIQDGPVDTTRFGSDYWASLAVAWEATDIGQQSIVMTLIPKEDASLPDPDLIPSVPISTQPEWQLGWTPPDPIKATGKLWTDQSTGITYRREESTGTMVAVTGTI